MNFPRRRPVFTLMLVFAALTVGLTRAETTSNREFGPWDAVVFDDKIVQDVRVSGDDIFIKLQPDHRNAKLTMKNSMQRGGPYRKWFNGEEVFVAQENSGRAANAWSDRMQTSANYIEYYADGKQFLVLKRR